jgi:hypothetical protein
MGAAWIARSCRTLTGIARLGESVLKMLDPLGMPTNLESIGDHVQRATRDEAAADIAAYRREIALVELTERRERGCFQLFLGDLLARLIGKRTKKRSQASISSAS